MAASRRDADAKKHQSPGRSDAERRAQRSSFTVLVDYQPVEAIWRRWSDDRTAVLTSATGAGFVFDHPRRIEIVEVTLPAALFPEQRAYEIAFAMESVSTVLSNELASRRLVLYNGGYQIPPRPCATEPLQAEALPIERAWRGASQKVLLFSDLTTDYDELRGKAISVSPGQEVRLFGSLWRKDVRPRVTVLQPVVNGEPLGSPFYATQGGINHNRYRYVEHRFAFDFVAPSAPGVYDIAVFTWADAFETMRDLEGNRDQGISSSGGVPHSNAVRLVVEEAQDR